MKSFFILLSTLLIVGCGGGSGGTGAGATKRIMPLGDSITWDWYFGDTRTAAERSGYRDYLWYKLENAGYSADFVGSRTTGGAIQPYFDGANEGHTGWTSNQIADNVYGFLQMNPADIILLHIGTNDNSSSVAGIERIFNEVDRFENDSGIHIQIIVSLVQLNPSLSSNLYTMAQGRIANGDNIVVVDTNVGGNLIDGIHPNSCGYEKMANAWFSALTGKPSPGIIYNSNCY